MPAILVGGVYVLDVAPEINVPEVLLLAVLEYHWYPVIDPVAADAVTLKFVGVEFKHSVSGSSDTELMVGLGLTVTVTVNVAPVQEPDFGVTV